MRKISIVWMAALLFALAGGVAACGGGDAGSGTTTAAASVTSLAPGGQVFSLEQLAGFDGKEGRPAYM